MAGSLTIRITQTDPDETRNIPVEDFLFAVFTVLNGRHSQANISTFFGFSPAEETQFAGLITKIQSGSATIQVQLARVLHVRNILTTWENDNRPAAYATPDDIETELSSIDSYPV